MYIYAVALLAIEAFAIANAAAVACTNVNSCVKKSSAQSTATSWCSSYLSIGTATITVASSTATSKTTITTTSTSWRIDPVLIHNCNLNSHSDLARRMAATKATTATTATSSLPPCFRAYTAASQFSSACSCLHIPSPTSKITSGSTTITKTFTKHVTTTLSAESVWLYEKDTNQPICNGGSAGAFVDFGCGPTTYNFIGADYQRCALAAHGSNGQPLIATTQTNGTGNLVMYSPNSVPHENGIPSCKINPTTYIVTCAAGNANVSVNDGGWAIVPGPVSSPIQIVARPSTRVSGPKTSGSA